MLEIVINRQSYSNNNKKLSCCWERADRTAYGPL